MGLVIKQQVPDVYGLYGDGGVLLRGLLEWTCAQENHGCARGGLCWAGRFFSSFILVIWPQYAALQFLQEEINIHLSVIRQDSPGYLQEKADRLEQEAIPEWMPDNRLA